MERRLLLAIVLTFVVLTVYQWLVPVPPPARAPQQVPQKSGPAPPAQNQPQVATPPSSVPPAAAPDFPAAETRAPEQAIVIDNGHVRATFSSRGATLRTWELLNYQGPDGQPVDLVPDDVPADQPKPFALRLDDPAKSARINAAPFTVTIEPPATPTNDASQPSGSRTVLNATRTAVAVTFEYRDAAGLYARKHFRIEPNAYDLTFTANVRDGETTVNPFVRLGPGLGDVLAMGGGSMFIPVRKAEAIYSIAGDVERVQAADLPARYQGDYEFAGVDTHYFISTAVRPGAADLEYYPLSIPSQGTDAAASRDYVGYDIRFRASPGGPQNVRFFMGPKHFETLRQVDQVLVRAIWFGMFAFLSVPLLSALNWVYGFVGNYGWSIIVLTFIINAVMFPLRHKSNVSMRKMQAIQPQVKAIQDRYSKLKVTDPARQKMNTELMELYRQKGVNPASGCVPMLLTFPVLLAFYSLLSEAIELRGAPFIWWIRDLAAADPYYVTPILMGASQVVQQKMTPMTGADPVQQKMMLFMPILFTFLFLTSPAGLALYWFASNVLVIVQQVLTNRMIGVPKK
jgi:YidC/Oxa1 family membrane protein insertase